MNMEIGTEAARFLEKKYLKGIFVAVVAHIRYQKTADFTHSAVINIRCMQRTLE